MNQHPYPPQNATTGATIGERIRQARKAAALNQTALAERVGVSQPAVAAWESGVHDPRRLVIVRIAETLNVSPEWLASGARSSMEQDRHPAAAYIRRPLQHTPIISLTDAARLLHQPEFDPHAVAEDYIPVTTSAERVFAIFADDIAVDRAFPKNTLVVIDYTDRLPADGMFCLAMIDGAARLRRWNTNPDRFEADSTAPNLRAIPASRDTPIIGCARVSIRFH